MIYKIKRFSFISKLFSPKNNNQFPEIDLIPIIDKFPGIKKDISNLLSNKNKIWDLGEKIIDLGFTNGDYHPGFIKGTSWIDKSGYGLLIEGFDMDGSLLVNTDTGKLEDCLGNKYKNIKEYLKHLILEIDSMIDDEDDINLKKEFIKIWNALKPLLK